MAAVIPALMGAQMVSNLISGLFQQNNSSLFQQGNVNADAYRQGVRDGVFFDRMQHHHEHGGDTNITINNFNPKDRILF